MKKLLVLFVVFCMIMPLIAGNHNDRPMNIDRLVTGKNNYGTDPNSTADVSMANDDYITNDTSGVVEIEATRTRVTDLYVEDDATFFDDVSIADNITAVDSILGDFVIEEDSVRIYKDTFSKYVPQALNASLSYNPQIMFGTVTNPTAIDTITLPAAYTASPAVFLQAQEASTDSTLIWTLDSVSTTVKNILYVHCDLLVPTSAADTCLIREGVTTGTGSLHWQTIGK